MTKNLLFRKTGILLVSMTMFFSSGLRARDLDLDGIYLSRNSGSYQKLIIQKLEGYRLAGSRVVERDIIFARWISGADILYVREFQSVNVIYRYNRNTSRHIELARIPGTISGINLAQDGRYLYAKTLTIERNPIPVNRLMIIDTGNGKTVTRNATFPFMDITLSPQGQSFLYESRKGIMEEFPDTGTSRLLISHEKYGSLRKNNGNPTLVLLSPNRQYALLINGSGGFYNSIIVGPDRESSFQGISSTQETFWMNNNLLIYRSGNTGNYGVTIESVKDGTKRQLFTGSLNTNLCLSPVPGRAAFLMNQLIMLYDINSGIIQKSGLEGEDVYFSPDGSRFLSLFHKTLFITHERQMLGAQSAISKNSETLLSIYHETLKDRTSLINEYSSDYCRQKISAYEQFVRMK
jgi:hypothetical protein